MRDAVTSLITSIQSLELTSWRNDFTIPGYNGEVVPMSIQRQPIRVPGINAQHGFPSAPAK
jgi:hypothetical protein